MSTFVVKVVRIAAIEPIEGADNIELAVVGDYRSVVGKGQYHAGDLAVYIPEGAIVPNVVLRSIGLEGKLAGSNHDRVKAIKLRGCLSQGILYPVDSGSDIDQPFITLPTDDGIGAMHVVHEGDDVKEVLGITKYVPVIPASMSGEVYYAGRENTVNFDIENYKAYPNILIDGEQVVFTEKLHGTFCGVGILPVKDASPNHFMNRIVIFSKGLGADGLCFKDVEANANNIYIKTLREVGVLDKLMELYSDRTTPVFFLGEVFGTGVQDLGYGTPPTFRVFAAVTGYRGEQEYQDWGVVKHGASRLGVETVPVLYEGPFSKEVMLKYTSGKETISGTNAHMREGIVVTPVVERRDPIIGRVILKSVSAEYLARKDKNATEYQ